MVSQAKRLKYVSDLSSSEDEDMDYIPEQVSTNRRKGPRNTVNQFQPENTRFRTIDRKPTRVPKVFSKNALLARENRLRKKQYMTNLETDLTNLKDENKKLSTVVDNQSFLIGDLKKQIKYLKSVIANSEDIGRLVRNIHHSTGMSVASSLDKTLSLNNMCVPKRTAPIGRKTAHPWDDEKQYPSFPTPESLVETLDNNNSDLSDFGFDLLSDNLPDFPINLPEDELFDTKPVDTLSEHNYTQKSTKNDNLEEDQEDDDIGVCLHVSKHRVSLEFCSTCSDNAGHAWI